jgi:hypothetical protein
MVHRDSIMNRAIGARGSALHRIYARLLRLGLAHVMPGPAPPGSKLRAQFDKLETAMDRSVDGLATLS